MLPRSFSDRSWHHFCRFGMDFGWIFRRFWTDSGIIFKNICNAMNKRKSAGAPPSNGRIPKLTAKSRQEPAQNKAHRRLPQNIQLEFGFHPTQSTASKRIPRNGTCPKRGAAVSRRMASSIIIHNNNIVTK